MISPGCANCAWATGAFFTGCIIERGSYASIEFSTDPKHTATCKLLARSRAGGKGIFKRQERSAPRRVDNRRQARCHVCENFTCKAPVTDAKALHELLVAR